MMTRVFSCAILLIIAAPAPAFAWGNVGHQVVCEIAWQRLTPQARQLILQIRDGDEAPTFARSCTWADAVRKTTHKHTAGFHFINIPEGQTGVDLARDCGTPVRCAPWAIAHYADTLMDAGQLQAERNEALKFIAHFVGDLHQPLHAGRASDLGGNDIHVNFFGDGGTSDNRLTLHAVWDSRILARAGIDLADAALLASEVTAAEVDAWTRPLNDVDLLAWTNESYRFCEDFVYPRLPASRRIRTAYYDPALEITRQQLKKGGVRLAYLLNQAAAGTLRFAN